MSRIVGVIVGVLLLLVAGCTYIACHYLGGASSC